MLNIISKLLSVFILTVILSANVQHKPKISFFNEMKSGTAFIVLIAGALPIAKRKKND